MNTYKMITLCSDVAFICYILYEKLSDNFTHRIFAANTAEHRKKTELRPIWMHTLY